MTSTSASTDAAPGARAGDRRAECVERRRPGSRRARTATARRGSNSEPRVKLSAARRGGRRRRGSRRVHALPSARRGSMVGRRWTATETPAAGARRRAGRRGRRRFRTSSRRPRAARIATDSPATSSSARPSDLSGPSRRRCLRATATPAGASDERGEEEGRLHPLPVARPRAARPRSPRGGRSRDSPPRSRRAPAWWLAVARPLSRAAAGRGDGAARRLRRSWRCLGRRAGAWLARSGWSAAASAHRCACARRGCLAEWLDPAGTLVDVRSAAGAPLLHEISSSSVARRRRSRRPGR